MSEGESQFEEGSYDLTKHLLREAEQVPYVSPFAHRSGDSGAN
jgi:hypothetical protein